MSAPVCPYCGGPHKALDCVGGQAKRLAVLVMVLIAMFVVATDIAVNFWIYGDPLCAFKTCIETH